MGGSAGGRNRWLVVLDRKRNVPNRGVIEMDIYSTSDLCQEIVLCLRLLRFGKLGKYTIADLIQGKA